MPADRIVAVCLLTQGELDRYGTALKKIFPAEATPRFDELLRLLDEADRRHWRAPERTEALNRLRSQANG